MFSLSHARRFVALVSIVAALLASSIVSAATYYVDAAVTSEIRKLEEIRDSHLEIRDSHLLRT